MAIPKYQGTARPARGSGSSPGRKGGTEYNSPVRTARPLRFINLSIAVLFILLLLAVYWLAWRPLPKVSGTVSAPVAAGATVRRDKLGIPHIEAASWQDAIFLQGFVTAQDRLWQMDGLRRFGAGELSEIVGPAALDTDKKARPLRMRTIAESYVRNLSPEDRAVLVEYARGVNYFIETQRGKYPLEFSIPGRSYDPRPWTPTDSLIVGLVMFRNLTTSWEEDFAKQQLLTLGGPAKVQYLIPKAAGQMENPGSNAWAVAGRLTTGGKPILANDTHLEYGIPATWHLVHLKAPGLNVSGAALPGVPCVLSGHNEQIAWGITNLEADFQDLYQEQIDLKTGRYLFAGKPEQAQLDRQFIGVLGAKPVQTDTWVTRHGPVILSEGGRTYSLRWTATDGFTFPFFDINRAHNWQEFRTAVSRFWGPPQNFIYADREGNIGYQATGKVPIRRNFYGDVPLDGSSGQFEWDGYIPFEQLPSVFNPPSGIAVSSNQNPFPSDYPFHTEGDYADKYRLQQIKALLKSRSRLKPEDMVVIQKDVYSAYDRFLAHTSVTAFDRKGASSSDVQEAVRLLRAWDGQMEKSKPEPFITALLHRQINLALMQQLAKGQAVRLSIRPQAIERLLTERPAGWVADWDQWILTQLNLALEEGRKRQGSPASKWSYGLHLRWLLAHPVGRQLPFFSRYFNIGPVEMSGSSTTVKQTTERIGPSMRLIADFSDLDRSLQSLTTGESGNVASKHYKDQWPSYYIGKAFPMRFNHIETEDVLRVEPSK